MQQMQHIESIPVAYETDIVVIGGGPAGVGAAFTAAREGKQVIIVEQMNCLGGIATAGLHGHLCLYSTWGGRDRVVGGLGHEICERIQADGYGVYDGAVCDFEVEYLKFLLEKMAQEIGNIKILYYTQFSDVIVEDGLITHVIIQNKSGRQVIRSSQVVDSSGDADVAARAGVPFEFGRENDDATQPMTLMFQLGGIDFERVQNFRSKKYVKKYNDENSYKMHKLWKEAQDKGDMEPFQDGIMGWWYTPTRPDQLGINFTHIHSCDCTNTEDLTYATIEGRRQAYHCVAVYRKYVPGMEDCWMSHSASLIGTRESRRIRGEHILSEEDIVNKQMFEDSIGYGSFFIDIHNCTGSGMDLEEWVPPEDFKYQIPYRCLVPQKINNLLVAGRCVSCTHIALGSLRVMPQCMLMGEAVGAAAAIAIDSCNAPRAIEVPVLQKTLKKHGAILFEGDIVQKK